jgi:HrpA-like RNA helicase
VRIVVCEPRRLAAVTVATRVAQERDEKLGQVVSKTPQTILEFFSNKIMKRQYYKGKNL